MSKREPKAVKKLLGKAKTSSYRQTDHGRWMVNTIRAIAAIKRKEQGR